MDLTTRVSFIINDATNCWECTSHKPGSDGYCTLIFKRKHYKIHRLFYEKHKEKISDGLIIRHTCDNRRCINPDHLISGTHADNVKDRVDRHRSATGLNNGQTKLTLEEARCIKYEETGSTLEIAKKYNIDRTVVSKIQKGLLWQEDLPIPRSSDLDKFKKDGLGENSSQAKLTSDIVFKIKYKETLNAVEMAKKYNVDPATIRHILSGKTWKHI
jgi:uncharacterized protein YueI